jgi:copper(I)-binding protein
MWRFSLLADGRWRELRLRWATFLKYGFLQQVCLCSQGGCSPVTATFRTGRRLACVAVLAALPLTACAAGYQAETSRERTTLTSVSAVKGNLTIRNMFFVGPAAAGDSLPLYFATFNGGNSADKLVNVASSVATGSSAPEKTDVTGGGSLFYNAGDGSVPQLTGLKNKVLVGQTITVTLSFAQAGDVTVKVPVESSTLAAPSPLPSESATPTASATSTVSPSAVASATEAPSASASAAP